MATSFQLTSASPVESPVALRARPCSPSHLNGMLGSTGGVQPGAGSSPPGSSLPSGLPLTLQQKVLLGTEQGYEGVTSS